MTQTEFDKVARQIADLQLKYGSDSDRLVRLKLVYETFIGNMNDNSFELLKEEVRFAFSNGEDAAS